MSSGLTIIREPLVFGELITNGTWRLYVVDGEGSDVGAMTGWVLTLTTQ